MMTRFAIAAAVGTMLAAAPAQATVGIGWGPEDHGVRTVVVDGRVLSLPRDHWSRHEPLLVRTGGYGRDDRRYRHPLLDR
ncbi:MAG TPA: hypothetical protein VGC77_04280 [Rhodopseudomonas sp.]|uniref:hypothetical protein n=1 Tax=Rhodopseudomonas sp. TaxID=1078 RepID=UPI002ED91815